MAEPMTVVDVLWEILAGGYVNAVACLCLVGTIAAAALVPPLLLVGALQFAFERIRPSARIQRLAYFGLTILFVTMSVAYYASLDSVSMPSTFALDRSRGDPATESISGDRWRQPSMLFYNMKAAFFLEDIFHGLFVAFPSDEEIRLTWQERPLVGVVFLASMILGALGFVIYFALYNFFAPLVLFIVLYVCPYAVGAVFSVVGTVVPYTSSNDRDS